MDDKYNELKDSESIITQFADILKNKILAEDEQLLDTPGTFTSLFSSFMGDISTNQFYEMLSIKNEATPKTAIFRENLFKYLDSDSLAGIFATPASMSFVIGFKKEELIKNSIVVDKVNGTRLLRLNQRTTLNITNYPEFRLLDDIDIFINSVMVNGELEYSIYAKYSNNSARNSILKYNSPLIKSNNILMNDNEYFVMYVDMKQYDVAKTEYDIYDNKHLLEFKMGYVDQMIGFEVFYENKAGDQILLNGEIEGVENTNGYNYSLSNILTDKSLSITFKQSSSSFKPDIGGKIIIKNYFTYGELGNYTLTDISKNVAGLNIKMQQDISDDYQDKLVLLKPLISLISSESVGGSNEKTLEEVRSVVYDTIGNSNELLSSGALLKYIKSLGLTASQTRFDNYQINYMVYDTLRDNKNNIIPTRNGKVELILDNTDKVLAASAYIIHPDNIYKLFDGFLHKTSNIDDLTDTYRFPYFIRLALDKYISTNVYDLSINDSPKIGFDYYNEKLNYKSDVQNLVITRNPLDKTYKDKYIITFDVNVTDLLYEEIKNIILNGENINNSTARLNIHLALYDRINANEFIIDINRLMIPPTQFTEDALKNEGVITVALSLPTNNGINNIGELMITDHALIPITFMDSGGASENYFINNFDLTIVSMIKSDNHIPSSVKYDKYLYQKDIDDNYSVSTVFKIENINLCRNISDYFSINTDVKLTERVYDTYTENIPKLYETIIYDHNDDDSIKYEDVTIYPNANDPTYSETMSVPVILHKIGDPMFQEDGTTAIYTHMIGDVKTNENGPIIKIDEFGNPLNGGNKVIFNNMPVTAKLFLNEYNFYTILYKYEQTHNKLALIHSKLIDHCTATYTLKNTSGPGKLKFKQNLTGMIETVDDMSFSLDLGLKLDEFANVEFSVVVEEVIQRIITYVNTFDKAIFSINELFQHLTDNIANINYFEFYKLNDYNIGQLRSIYYNADDDIESEVFNIKIMPTEDYMENIPQIKIHQI